METITIAKNNFKIEAIYVLKCQMYGKLKIPCSAIFISKLPMKYDSEVMEKGATLSVGQKQLIAFARVVSDFIYKAIIFDVIVSENNQGIGLGKELIQRVKSHEHLHKVKHFELYCLPEMAAFYESFGFSTDIDGISLMRCVNT